MVVNEVVSEEVVVGGIEVVGGAIEVVIEGAVDVEGGGGWGLKGMQVRPSMAR